ncbi:class I SAM-dependent methyltransferase [Laribacter hongkongensis]|uniref:class I SAM-dependent methyltransferase n=1 Tax=Laribacter hongkongensis TaxID=168471 RepID=UPI001EFDD60E|nr:class I SAM-dependent methyltransferase [Laribacter hongkongensis]MCG9029710.1 class I SAM-dependent methyltransferase [Laribacter hongkongensis]MCG9035825.1 class I SAM-dependent methyltransferase [Laribacter hongkongensis]MCG9038559.1 class I SAM-dependent methyltransferase [Laribacter hongkongensis]MCG9071518.1 class I SAM-dependent methyltransferase [Laribacter hongkongensis]
MEKLTDKIYWEETYNRRKNQSSLDVDGFTNFSNRLILNKMLEVGMMSKRVLEIGAGDSVWLPYLARKFPSSQFVGLDYSESGCMLLSKRAHKAGVNIGVIRDDMFVEKSQLHGSFDVVISFGVVEHFDDLGLVLAAKKRYLRSGGVIFTLIPNLAGILGRLVRLWNREIYDKHNPHDLVSFLSGHKQAGLTVISGGYLGSSNFGVLSSCFPERRGLPWQISRGLVAASLASWWFENKIGNLPSSKTFSPYIYAISQQA